MPAGRPCGAQYGDQGVAQCGSTSTSAEPYLYAGAWGYRSDGDAGLMLVGARYYDAQAGRFVTRDTLLGEHPYLYCEHEPVGSVDPSGHGVLSQLVALGCGVVGTALIPGPLGFAVGYGVGTILGDLLEGASVGSAIIDGVCAGGLTYFGGPLAGKFARWAKGGWMIGGLTKMIGPPIGALRPPVTMLPALQILDAKAFNGLLQ